MPPHPHLRGCRQGSSITLDRDCNPFQSLPVIIRGEQIFLFSYLLLLFFTSVALFIWRSLNSCICCQCLFFRHSVAGLWSSVSQSLRVYKSKEPPIELSARCFRLGFFLFLQCSVDFCVFSRPMNYVPFSFLQRFVIAEASIWSRSSSGSVDREDLQSDCNAEYALLRKFKFFRKPVFYFCQLLETQLFCNWSLPLRPDNVHITFFFS